MSIRQQNATTTSHATQQRLLRRNPVAPSMPTMLDFLQHYGLLQTRMKKHCLGNLSSFRLSHYFR